LCPKPKMAYRVLTYAAGNSPDFPLSSPVHQSSDVRSTSKSWSPALRDRSVASVELKSYKASTHSPCGSGLGVRAIEAPLRGGGAGSFNRPDTVRSAAGVRGGGRDLDDPSVSTDEVDDMRRAGGAGAPPGLACNAARAAATRPMALVKSGLAAADVYEEEGTCRV